MIVPKAASESPFLHPLNFFQCDPSHWMKEKMAELYETSVIFWFLEQNFLSQRWRSESLIKLFKSGFRE
jgi:hypothetical protein